MATTKNPATKTPSATGLYWNEHGAIACAEHTPLEGTDTWLWERWEPMSPESVVAFSGHGYDAVCETCQRVSNNG